MKVILDECLPRRLATQIAGHDVITVPSAGLAGLKNGTLLNAIENEYDAFITIDANLQYQQALQSRSLFVIVLRAVSNRLDDLLPLVPSIIEALDSGQAQGVVHIG